MSEVDWKEAPEWAKVVGRAGIEKLLIWSDHKKYSYVNGDCDGKSFNIGAPCAWRTDEITITESRPEQQWNGEGVPPVGVACDRRTMAGGDGRYEQVRILAHTSRGSAVWESLDGMFAGISKEGRKGGRPEFRPIRNAEHIATEEREEAISIMVDIGCGYSSQIVRSACVELYDAGYRKP